MARQMKREARALQPLGEPKKLSTTDKLIMLLSLVSGIYFSYATYKAYTEGASTGKLAMLGLFAAGSFISLIAYFMRKRGVGDSADLLATIGGFGAGFAS